MPMNPAVKQPLVRILGAAVLFLLSAYPSSDSAGAVKVIESNEMVIELGVGSGRLIRLDSAMSTAFVAEPKIADIQVKSPRLVYVFAREPGETSLFAVDDRERVLLNARIRVTHDLDGLRTALGGMLPDSAIKVKSLNSSIILTGRVPNATAAEDARRIAVPFSPQEGGVINQLRVDSPNQVSLRVRIAEVSREVVKELGFNWESSISKNDFGFVLGTGRDAIPAGSSSFLRATQDVLGLTLNRGGLNLATLVDALETEGLITLLAEPNLTTVSGETASFLAGGEFPIPVSQDNGQVTIEFKKFGVSLAFTPTIVGNGRINMRVRPEVSQLTSTGSVTANNFNIPALTTRRAETTVELGSGQSFAIGGLLQNNVDEDVRKFPGLGDLPILGPLFRSNRFQRNETELVILVTPYIVRPVSASRMAMPNDGLVMPNDTERIMAGQTYRPRLKESRPVPIGPGGERLIGPAGFELE